MHFICSDQVRNMQSHSSSDIRPSKSSKLLLPVVGRRNYYNSSSCIEWRGTAEVKEKRSSPRNKKQTMHPHQWKQQQKAQAVIHTPNLLVGPSHHVVRDDDVTFFSPADAINGAVSSMSSNGLDMREKAYRLCRDYLSGAWKRIGISEMVFKPISGGLSNLLYFCALPNTHQPLGNEPTQVLLRMYGQVHDEGVEAVITQSVIFTLLSERQLGPKLFGVFPGGRLEEYIPARSLTTSELRNPELSTIIAEKLATVHSLNAPISKEPTWLFDTMIRWLQYVRDKVHLGVAPQDDKPKVKKLLSYALEKEFEWLKKTIMKVGSPVVFSHNDLQEGNILINEMSKVADERLVFIDFEYCSYNYRGFDLANHFCEWCYDYSSSSSPYFLSNIQNYPTKEQQLLFIRAYLENMESLPCPPNFSNSNNMYKQYNIEEILLKEVYIFTLASHFFWGLWSIVNAQVSQIPFGYWDYAITRFDAYFQHKARVLADHNKRKSTSE